MYSTEEMVKAVLPYAAKRAAKIAVKDLRQKTGK
jgi:hypothetical protein